MIGTRIPTGKRIINSVSPLSPTDFSEANALNLMFLWDNMGSGDYMQDGSILERHLAQFLCQEQASPNLTLKVLAGNVWFGATFLAYAGGNSPSFVAPVTNPRIDALCINSAGTLSIIQGAEAGSPVAPAITAGKMALCFVYNVVGETVIHDNDTQVGGQGYILYDARPFMSNGGTVIKSIQQVSIAFTLTGAGGGGQKEPTGTATATITSVDTTKSVVILDGIDSIVHVAGDIGKAVQASVVLTNATTVTASAVAAVTSGNAVTFNVAAVVVEYL